MPENTLESNKMITGLTPLRGIAALLVVLFHYHIFIAHLLPKEFTPLIGSLYLMVDLFFILSGFIIYHVYGEYFSGTFTTKRFIQFSIARFARIYPLHLFSFFLVVGLCGIMFYTQTFNAMFKVTYDPTAVIPQLFLIHALGTHQEATWNAPSWSISVEWWTYMCFPLLVMLLNRGGQWVRWLMFALVLAGYLSIIFYFQAEFWRARWAIYGLSESVVPFPMHTLDILTGAAFLRCLCGFMLGMLLYEIYIKFKETTWFSSGWWSLLIVVLLFMGWNFDALNDLVAVALLALIILNVALNQGKFVSVLESKPLSTLGEISYSMYLMHMPVIFAYIGARKILVKNDPDDLGMRYAMSLGEAWLLCIAMVIVVIVLSLLTYHYIEKPSRRYLRGFSAENKPKQTSNSWPRIANRADLPHD